MGNRLTLAVAGSRKTQSIVEHCATLPRDRRAAVVTFTQMNQAELRARLGRLAGDHPGITMIGWFSFLMRDFVRPFLPFKFPGERVRGFNFEGIPDRFSKGLRRFLDSNGAVFKSELARLAHELIDASQGALLRRLECIYDEVLIDEVQDLSGYDLEILDALFGSSLRIQLVGDIRQAVIATNPRGLKNRGYAYAGLVGWFREREKRGVLEIVENSTTWRCRPEIAAFSDTIFEAEWMFPSTTSQNTRTTAHDGVFLLRSEHVLEYVNRYEPQCLRYDERSGTEFDLRYLNFGEAKGSTHERVLITPTKPMRDFVGKGSPLKPVSASKFYVAVTRAAQSLAIVTDDAGASGLPFWKP